MSMSALSRIITPVISEDIKVHSDTLWIYTHRHTCTQHTHTHTHTIHYTHAHRHTRQHTDTQITHTLHYTHITLHTHAYYTHTHTTHTCTQTTLHTHYTQTHTQATRTHNIPYSCAEHTPIYRCVGTIKITCVVLPTLPIGLISDYITAHLLYRSSHITSIHRIHYRDGGYFSTH